MGDLKGRYMINNEVIDNNIININLVLKKIVKNITLPVTIRLVQNTLKQWFPTKTHKELYEMILFKTSPSLAFQKSDIDSIHFSQTEGNVRVEITLNFSSIFGASSPLPAHYNERILEDSFNKKVLLDFLDMLNHRLKRLIYPIWEKQRYYILYEEDLSDYFSKYILSILGLYSQSKGVSTSLNLHKLLPFSGILSMHQKSTSSLVSILKHYFSHEDIYIEEGIVSKSSFPEGQYLRLGEKNSMLGEDTCIGSFVLSRNLKYRIHFNNMEWEDLEDFILNHSKKIQLFDLIQLIQKNPLSFDIALTVPKEKLKPCVLGESPLHLGSNTWIGYPKGEQTIIIEGSP